jgi:hypothetical protein
MAKANQVVSLSDISRRWGVTKQRVQYLYKNDENFPEVFTTIKQGQQPLFLLDDVIKYEPTKNMPKKAE